MPRTTISQDDVRRRTMLYLAENGVKDCFFAEEVGVPRHSLSRWKTQRKNLLAGYVVAIDLYLKRKGY